MSVMELELSVIVAGSSVTRPLPSSGLVTIGRADDADIRIKDTFQRAQARDDVAVSSRRISSFISPVIEDRRMQQLYDVVMNRIAQAPFNVLLLGETGVGKEVMAEAIHRHSTRAKGP